MEFFIFFILGISDIGGWAGSAGVRGYPPSSSYRHPNPYEQIKMNQYSQQVIIFN